MRCGLCERENPCKCLCHIDNKVQCDHEEISSLPVDVVLKKEGKAPMRLDFKMMQDGQIQKTASYRIRKLFRLI